MSQNKFIKCIIVDDEPPAHELLGKILTAFPSITIVGNASNVMQAFSLYDKEKPDLIFLDYDMPVQNGYDFLKNLPVPGPLVVIVSAHRHPAAESYNFNNVVDYVLKPLEIQRIEKAIEKVEERLRYMSLSQAEQEKFLKVRVERELIFIPFHDIERFEAKGNYVSIICTGKKPVLTKTSLKELLPLLPQEFIHVNRSNILRKDLIRKVNQSVELEGGKLLAIGSTFRSTLLALFKK